MISLAVDVQAVFFDMDGTLIDTEILYVQAVKQVLREHKCPISDEEVLYIVYGRSWSDVFHETQRRYPRIFPTLEILIKTVRRRFLDLRDRMDVRIPSSIDLLKQLAATYPVAIVSGSTRLEIQEGIEIMDISSYLAFYIGAEDCAMGKPDPACYHLAAEKMNCRPQHCLVFEDSQAGVQAAKNAGMYCVGLQRKNKPYQDLSQADLILEDLADFKMQSR